jgi:hypothetical protein
VTLSWTSVTPVAGPTIVHDVVRGTIDLLPVDGGAGESCLEPAVDGASTTDADVPAPGAAWWYLVRGRNACGAGSWGTSSAGAERTSVTCP